MTEPQDEVEMDFVVHGWDDASPSLVNLDRDELQDVIDLAFNDA